MKIKIIHIFNLVNTDCLIFPVKYRHRKNPGFENWQWRQTRGWVTCAKSSRRNTHPGVSHTFIRRLLKQNYPKYISEVVSKILKKKTQLSDLLSEFVIFLKLGFLWWKLKIFIANFFSCFTKPWRIFSMLSSHPTIKRRWKHFCYN